MSSVPDARPWLSIIIPTLNEADTLPDCLKYILGVLPDKDLEIIIADGGSSDGTLAYVATEPRLLPLPCTRGRARQMNAGAAIAKGEFLWFLHADTQPPPNWITHLRHAAMQGLPACFSLHFKGQDESMLLRFYARGSRLNHWLVRFGDQSLFLSWEQFEHSGGYCENHSLMEGHELVRRLSRRCGEFNVMPAAVVTSARRYRKYGIVFTQAVFSLIFCLYYLGLGQEQLLRIYRKAFGSSPVPSEGSVHVDRCRAK